MRGQQKRSLSPTPSSPSCLLSLSSYRAVLRVVDVLLARSRELAGLADRDEGGVEVLGHARAEEKASRIQTDDDIDGGIRLLDQRGQTSEEETTRLKGGEEEDSTVESAVSQCAESRQLRSSTAQLSSALLGCTPHLGALEHGEDVAKEDARLREVRVAGDETCNELEVGIQSRRGSRRGRHGGGRRGSGEGGEEGLRRINTGCGGVVLLCFLCRGRVRVSVCAIVPRRVAVGRSVHAAPRRLHATGPCARSECTSGPRQA